METIEVILFVIMLLYVTCIASLVIGFARLRSFQQKNMIPKTAFSIVVPFRNEKENLPNLLQSLLQLNYPKELFEVILVNDDSDDGFVVSKMNLDIKILESKRLSHSPKKDAIQIAITQAKNDWVITTDADCIVPESWLTTLDAFIQKHPKAAMVCGAVSFSPSNKFLQHFQQLDVLSLQGATMGGFGLGLPFMCNGAHLAYTKKIFGEVHGFAGNDGIMSGDDVFLLQKVAMQFPEQVFYLKSGTQIVITQYETTWKSLFFQRVRWAAKSTAYKSVFGKLVALMVFVANVTVVFTWFLLFFQEMPLLYVLLWIIIIKWIIDGILLFQVARLIKITPKGLLISNLLYPFFSTAVAVFSLFGSYTWKGRNAKK